MQQRNLCILFAHQHMSELMTQRQGTERADRIHKQRVGSVERMNESSPIGEFRPSRRLDSSRNFQGQFVEILLAFIEGNLSLPHQAPKISVRGNVVETMIV